MNASFLLLCTTVYLCSSYLVYEWNTSCTDIECNWCAHSFRMQYSLPLKTNCYREMRLKIIITSLRPRKCFIFQGNHYYESRQDWFSAIKTWRNTVFLSMTKYLFMRIAYPLILKIYSDAIFWNRKTNFTLLVTLVDCMLW